MFDFVLARVYRQAKWYILKQIVESEEFYMKVLDSEKKEKVRRHSSGDASRKLANPATR